MRRNKLYILILCVVIGSLYGLGKALIKADDLAVGDIIAQDNLKPKNDNDIKEFQNISNWAQLAIEELGYISHLSIREDLAKARVFFTETGWQKYLQALESADLPSYLVENKATQVIKLSGMPNIKDKFENKDRVTWYIVIPVERLISLSNGSVNEQSLEILLVVHANKKQNDGYVPYRIEQIIFMG